MPDDPAPGTAIPPGATPAPRSLPAVAPLATMVAGLVCAAVGGAILGGRGLVSGLVATAVVAAFFWSGLVPLFLARDSAAAGLALVVLLVNYVLRLAVALAVLGAAVGAGIVDSGVVGVSVIVCALTYGATQAVLLSR